MTLERTDQPGLWRAAPAGSRGVHALIVGISEYPHLENGNAAAPDTAGMGQLAVSALTGARVFAWMRGRTHVAGAPLASCRLLLAPVAGERAKVDMLTERNYAVPDFATLRASVETWADEMAAAPTGGEPNVAFLLFSGHGIEHLSEPALLARDILSPGVAGRRNAIAFRGLWQSVRTFGVDAAFFFIDACRNAPEQVRLLGIEGQEVLAPLPRPRGAPESIVWLQATRTGAFAYQVEDAPATMFGQALIEALEGIPPDRVPYDRSGVPWRLVFGDLEKHVKRRTRELIAERSASQLQPVQPGGYPYNADALVAELDPDEDGQQLRLQSAEWSEAPERGAARKDEDVLGGFEPAPPGIRHQNLRRYDVMHQVFGHEALTWPWIRSVRVTDGTTRRRLTRREVRLLGSRRSERGEAITVWLDLDFQRREGSSTWIEVGRGIYPAVHAIAVPVDPNVTVPVRLDLRFGRGPASWELQDLTGRLGDPSELSGGSRRIWTPLWEAQRHEALSSLGTAEAVLRGKDVLAGALQNKLSSPVAAAIGAAYLLRTGALKSLHDWPRNLANWFPELPDGPILWAETLRRRIELAVDGADARAAAREASGPRRERIERIVRHRDFRELIEYFVASGRRGVPLLGPTLTFAAGLSRLMREAARADLLHNSDALAVCAAVDRAAQYAVSGSLFVALVGQAPRFGPQLLGPPLKEAD